MSVTEVLRTEKSWIQKSFQVCGGDACIRDTRIPVWALVAARQRGVDQEEMLHYFVTPLTPEDIETAWVYYEQHEQEIQRTMQEHKEACRQDLGVDFDTLERQFWNEAKSLP